MSSAAQAGEELSRGGLTVASRSLLKVIRVTGFLKGLYTDAEMKSDNVKVGVSCPGSRGQRGVVGAVCWPRGRTRRSPCLAPFSHFQRLQIMVFLSIAKWNWCFKGTC